MQSKTENRFDAGAMIQRQEARSLISFHLQMEQLIVTATW